MFVSTLWSLRRNYIFYWSMRSCLEHIYVKTVKKETLTTLIKLHSSVTLLSLCDDNSSATAIRSYTQKGRFREALSLYVYRHASGHLQSDKFVIAAVLKACSHVSARKTGISIHAQMYKLGHSSDVYTRTALVDFYSKLDGIISARKAFNEMPVRNVVTWNTILSAYLKSGDLQSARKLFDGMPIRDVVSWNSMISGYANAGDMNHAVALFCMMPEKNPASWNGMMSGWIEHGKVHFARDLFDKMPEKSNVSWVTMISGYARCRDVQNAKCLFDQMEDRDLYSWNAMISCYAQGGHPREAIELFNRMCKVHINGHLLPDEMTFSSVISACSQMGNMRFGLWLEKYMSCFGIKLDEHLKTALIDFHAKCGNMGRAFELFSVLRKRDIVSYSAMILGCGMNGLASDAIHLFERMLDDDVFPNSVTFMGLLAAYRHAGLVEKGINCLLSMWRVNKVAPSANHYAIVVDLLGRAGRLEEAYRLITNMPMQPQIGAWGALLFACRLHGNVKLGEIAARNCFNLEPEASGYYVLLANIYAEAGKWEEAKRLRQVMRKNGVNLTPGFSWVESEPCFVESSHLA